MALAGLTIFTWRLPFFVYGLVGIIVAAIFWYWFRDRPGLHPKVNPEEAELISGGEPHDPAPLGRPPIRAYALSPAMWLISFVQFCANFAWVFIITLLPTYLADEKFGIGEDERAWAQLTPLVFGIFGMVAGGYATDFAVKKFGLRWGRAVPIAGTRLVVGLAYVICALFSTEPWLVVGMMCIVSFATDMGTAPVWAFGQDVGGRHVGAAIGWLNMWGNIGAAASPHMVIAMRNLGETPMEGWRNGFWVCVGVQCVAAVASLGIDARKTIGAKRS